MQFLCLDGLSTAHIKLHLLQTQDLINNDKPDIEMILQVHDELIFEVPADFTDEDIKPIISIMEETTKISVPLKVEYGFGANWREAH